MKKHIKSILLLLVLLSCQSEPVVIINPHLSNRGNFKLEWIDYEKREREQGLSIIEIDSCEYLVGNHDRSRFLTHKGNCKHCIARNSQKQP